MNWIDIKDKLPKEQGQYLAYDQDLKEAFLADFHPEIKMWTPSITYGFMPVLGAYRPRVDLWMQIPCTIYKEAE